LIQLEGRLGDFLPMSRLDGSRLCGRDDGELGMTGGTDQGTIDAAIPSAVIPANAGIHASEPSDARPKLKANPIPPLSAAL
jgi:hypothetical protein